MMTYLLYFAIITVANSYAVSASLQDDISGTDIKTRLSILEAKFTQVLDKNEELEKRVSALENENEALKKSMADLRESKVFKTPEGQTVNETNQGKSKKQHRIVPGNPEIMSSISSMERKRQATSTTIAFTAVVGTPSITVGPGQTVVYESVVTNMGAAYDRITGIFTAPVSGVYAFNFAEMVDPGKDEYLELVKEGTHVMWNYGHAAGSSHLVSASRTATIAVSKGSRVWVRTQNDVHHGTGRIHGNGFTTFSGWIIAYTE